MTESAVKVEMENLSEVKRRLSIEVPLTEVAEEVDKAYRDLGKRVKVKGFRPGKVPRGVLEMYYHKQIDKDVSDALVRRSLDEALKEKDLKPVHLSWPEPPPAVVAGENYRYQVELEVTPEFKVEDYLGLTVSAPPVAVSDAEVEAGIEEIRQSHAQLNSPAKSRGAKLGDFVKLDHQAYYEGQAAEGGKAEGVFLEVGSGKFNAEFESKLLGLKEGAESRFEVNLPDDFANPLLAGKPVEFEVKVHEVKEKVVPDLDDEFVKGLGGNFQGVADLREAVREDIIKMKERTRQTHLENQVKDQLLARTAFEAPPSLIQEEQEHLFREQWNRLSQYGVKAADVDQTKMLEAIKPLAERRVRVNLLLERIADQEGLTVDDAEADAALASIAASRGREFAEVRKLYQEHDLMGALKRQLLEDKTMKMLLDQAILSEAPLPAPEAEE